MEKELSPYRVWLYARIPGDYVGTMDSIKVCALQAHADGCTVSQNSKAFAKILVAAGLRKELPDHKAHKQGRNSKRETSEVTFHCLRHTATSLLKNAGVSDVVAREIIGHKTEAISRAYTHIESKTMRRAIDALPDVTKAQKGE